MKVRKGVAMRKNDDIDYTTLLKLYKEQEIELQ